MKHAYIIEHLFACFIPICLFVLFLFFNCLLYLFDLLVLFCFLSRLVHFCLCACLFAMFDSAFFLLDCWGFFLFVLASCFNLLFGWFLFSKI